MDDYALLQQYAQDRLQEAFTSLVRRYVGLVYSSALRQTHDPHQAEDATQEAFISLARKAHRIRANVVLSGWLLTAVRYQTLRDRRSRFRRRYHEHRAAQMVTAVDEQRAQQEWEQIAPQLDAAIADLGQKNRDALLLRYFEGQSMAEVGGRLGISEEAARQRVCRAIEHLREFFAGRGVEVTSFGLVRRHTRLSVSRAEPVPRCTYYHGAVNSHQFDSAACGPHTTRRENVGSLWLYHSVWPIVSRPDLARRA